MRALVSSLVLLLAAQALAITLPPNPEFDVRRVIPGNTYQGITFTPSGDLFMTSGVSVCKWPNAASLPIGSTLSFANATCANSNVASTNIVSSQTGRIYNVNGYEIDPVTFQATKRWNDCGASHGIAIDPRDGAVFVSNVGNGQVWRIPNPDTTTGVYQTNCVADLYFNAGSAGLGGFDAITIGPDGTFYGAGWTNHYLIVIKPWSSSSPQGTLIAAKPTLNANPDGISICVSNGNSFALVAMTGNVISKFNLSGPGGAPVYAESTIATNVGGYLDFTAVDPKGCIWGTTLTINGAAQGVYRVTNADGSCGCASAQVPASDVCPNCNDVTTASYPGSVAFTAQSISSHHCATIAFSA